MITTTDTLDYEFQRDYSFIITASDNGAPPLLFSFFMVINVMDENDNPPLFQRESNIATIPENSPLNSFVTSLPAFDRDSGNNSAIVYSIVGSDDNSVFSIDSTSGVVMVRRPEALDFETTRIFSMQVQAQDMGDPPASSRTLVSKFMSFRA